MEERDKNLNISNFKDADIDLLEITIKLWKKRRFILKTTIIFVTFGLIFAFSSKNEFTASMTLVPQLGERKTNGSLSGLAAMAGINLGSMNSNDVLSPSVYPLILNNINFQKELLYSKFTINKAKTKITYYEFKTSDKYKSFNLFQFIYKYTLGLPNIIISAIKSNESKILTSDSTKTNIQKLTFEENNIIHALFSRLSLNLNDKDGYITLSFTSDEPLLSAEVVKVTQSLLQKYITEFKLQKVKNNLEFIENSYKEAKKNFEDKQAELANFRDRNKTLSSEISKTTEEKLASEYNLLLNIYAELAKQREQAKISITETTPIFTIIKPVIVPNEKSGPKRSIILVGFVFFGIIFGIGWVIIKQQFIDLKTQLKHNG